MGEHMKNTTHMRVPKEFKDTIKEISMIDEKNEIDVIRDLNKELGFRMKLNDVGGYIFGWKRKK